MQILTPAERRALRAKAHHLHPFVIVGQHGLTPAVLHEIDVNLMAHGLIKIRVASDDRGEREALLARISDELGAAPVQHLGKILTLWRPSPESEPVVPKSRAKAPAGAARPARQKPRDDGPRARGRSATRGTTTAITSGAGPEPRRRKSGPRTGNDSGFSAEPDARRRKPAPRAGKPAAFAADPAARRRKPAPRSGKPAAFAADPVARRHKPAPRTGKPAAFAADPAARRRKPAPRSGKPAASSVDPGARRRRTKP